MSSNQNDPIDQAEKLRKRMENNNLTVENKVDESIIVSELPPRSEIHRKKDDEKVKLRIQFPIVRLLTLIFILIVCSIPIFFIMKDRTEQTQISATEAPNVDVLEIKGKDREEPKIVEKEEVPPIKEESKIEHINSAENTVTVPQLPIEVVKKEKDQFFIHIVKPGETLYRISMKYFNSRNGEPILIKFNGLDANGTIFVGQRLKIPQAQQK